MWLPAWLVQQSPDQAGLDHITHLYSLVLCSPQQFHYIFNYRVGFQSADATQAW